MEPTKTPTAFSPGPWEIDEFRESYSGRHTAFIAQVGGQRVAQVRYTDATATERKANAYLISESPAMYSALLTAREHLLRYSDSTNVDYIDNVLAKARGE